MVCRGLLLRLERAGHLQLPPAKGTHVNPLAERRRPRRPEIDESIVSGKLKDLAPIEFRSLKQVLGYPLEKQFWRRLGEVSGS